MSKRLDPDRNFKASIERVDKCRHDILKLDISNENLAQVVQLLASTENNLKRKVKLNIIMEQLYEYDETSSVRKFTTENIGIVCEDTAGF